MSRKQQIKHMSSEELKSKLYAHFQKSGSLDHLRAQLRGQLVSELFKVSEPIGPDKYPNVSDVEKCLLPLQVCNWLVYDHLSRQDYQYSLSTFVTEAQLPYPEKFLTAGDVLGLLGLSHNAADFENISKLYSENNELGYLHSLLLAIIKALFNISSRDLTLNQSHYQNIEVHTPKKSDSGQEESTHSFARNKPEIIGDKPVPEEFPKFKQTTLNRSLLTNDDVKSTDTSFLEQQLQSVKEEKERELQKIRHRLLAEVENLHSQERKMKLEIDFTKSELRKEQNKLIKEREMLKDKEVLLEKEMANKFEMKMRQAESDFASHLHFRDKEIESLKIKLMEKDQKLVQVETELASEKENCSLLKRELHDSKHMYKIIQDKYCSVLDENTNLQKKFENMSDYTILKEELATKSKEVARLQHEIKDFYQISEAERKKYVETVRNLEDNLNMKEPQLIQARKELDHVRNTLSSEQAVWNKEFNKKEHELNEIKELYKTVIQIMEDQKETIDDLNKTVHILNYKLTNNVINIAKSESVGSYKSFQKTADILRRGKQETVFTKRNISFQQPSEKYNDSSLQFLSDAKSRCSKLKKEEEAVQEKYSFIFSAIPEQDNKQNESYLKHYNLVSSTKRNVENYDTFSKPTSVNSSLHYDKWSKNELPTYTKNPYSLNDVKQMVTHSLFPYKTNSNTDFQRSNLGMYSQVPNFTNTFKDIWKASSTYTHSKSDNQYSLTEPCDNFNLNTVGHGNTPDKNNGAASDSSSKAKSHNKEVSENYESVITKGQSEVETLVVSDTDKLQQESENISSSRRNTLLENSNKTLSSGLRENDIPSSSKNFEDISVFQSVSKNSALDPQTQSVLIQSNQKVHDVISKIRESKPESSSSIFVNLDDAWKKRPSITSLSYKEREIVDDAHQKLKPNDSFVPSSIISASSPVSLIVLDKPDSSFDQSKSKQDTEIVSNKSAENTGNERMKDNTADASNVIQLEDKGVEAENAKERQPAFSEVKQSSINDRITTETSENNTSRHLEEQDSTKSAEKIESVDSLSEMSEVHISCGSEAEQQKEDDSDAW